MPSEKRQRQDAGRLSRLEEQQIANRRSQRMRQLRSVGVLIGALLVVALVISVLSKDKSSDVSTTAASTSTTATSTTDKGGPKVSLPGAGASIKGTTPCPKEDGSSERTTSFEQAPPTCVKAGKTYTATLDTTEGTVVIALDAKAAPKTVNNFVVLSRYHFYDNVPFHRIIPGFMDQAGDPVGPTPGTGGPGYTIPDELPTAASPYPAGTLAMANTGQPNTGGSQWFIVVDKGGDRLSATYTVFGHVTKGQDVVDKINKFGDAATNGEPTKVVTIKTITITEA